MFSNLPYRKQFFKTIPMADVRIILEFETIIRNYLKLDKALKNENHGN